MKPYRQVRVLIHPGKTQTYVTVVARTASAGSQIDRIVHRGAVDPVDSSTVAGLLRACAEEITRAADRL